MNQIMAEVNFFRSLINRKSRAMTWFNKKNIAVIFSFIEISGRVSPASMFRLRKNCCCEINEFPGFCSIDEVIDFNHIDNKIYSRSVITRQKSRKLILHEIFETSKQRRRLTCPWFVRSVSSVAAQLDSNVFFVIASLC